MIFGVTMDGLFTRNSWLVANGNETPEIPKYERYASVLSRESARFVSSVLPALNNLDILSSYISNAYLNAPCAEKL